MKELIDLLNSFCREKRGDYVVTKYREKEHSFDTFVEWKVDYMTDLYVVSKRCWFVQRLLENDKIDFEHNKLQVIKDIDVRWEVIYDCTLFDKVDWVIMLLSISDNPIQDLISLLK